MSQGTFSDLLIRLETFKRIFVFCPKIDFLPVFLPVPVFCQCFLSVFSTVLGQK